VDAGYEVESQVVLRSAAGSFLGRADLKVKGTPVVVEFDGRAKYSAEADAESAHWTAKRRRDRIEDEGFPMLVVVWADLARPRLLIRRLERLLLRAGQDPMALRILRET